MVFFTDNSIQSSFFLCHDIQSPWLWSYSWIKSIYSLNWGCVVKCCGSGCVCTTFCDGAGGGRGLCGTGAGMGTSLDLPDISASFVRARCVEKSLLSEANSMETWKYNSKITSTWYYQMHKTKSVLQGITMFKSFNYFVKENISILW